MTTITLLVVLFAGIQQAGQGNRIADGETGKVCGIPTTYRTGQKCEVILVVTEGTASTDVAIPATIRLALPRRPEQLIGGYVCAAGRMAVTNSSAVLRVASQKDFEVVKAPNVPTVGGDALLLCDAGVQAPTVISERKPEYPSSARQANVQGLVELDAIVDTTGCVSDVRVLKSLDPELDQKAVEALRDRTFRPGTVDGKAVPVRVLVEMTFATRRRR
jgi:TonB family protein